MSNRSAIGQLIVPSPQSIKLGDPKKFSWIPTSGKCHLRILSPSTKPLSTVELDLMRRQEYARMSAMAECLRKRYQQVALVMDMEESDEGFGGGAEELGSHHLTPSFPMGGHEDDVDEDEDDDVDSDDEFVFQVTGRIDGIGVEQREESYCLAVRENGAPWEIMAKDMRGLFYGVQTILQIIQVCHSYSALWYEGHISMDYAKGGALSTGVRVPTLEICDWPVVEHRGYMKDISRCRIPKATELYKMVDMLAHLKYNQLQLYMEAAYSYNGHEEAWSGTSPLSASDIHELDAYCHARCIELVPNQNSLGHMHRWLIHDKYSSLAEQVEGMYHPFAKLPDVKEPFGMCPTDPKALELVTSLHDELVEQFNSNKLNVGMDETVDLGKGRSKEECARVGRGEVFLNYLLHLHENHQRKCEVRESKEGMQTQCWADIIHHYPSLVERIPKHSSGKAPSFVALEWGYDEGHPFEQHCDLFENNKVAFYVCPGTSSWATFAGRTKTVIANCREAGNCVSSRAHGIGMLLTDWGDNGHLQPEFVSYIGIVCGAEHSWSAGRERDQHQESELIKQETIDTTGNINANTNTNANANTNAQQNNQQTNQLSEELTQKDGNSIRSPTAPTPPVTLSSPLLRRVEEGGKEEANTSTPALNSMESMWSDEDWTDVRTVLGISRRTMKNPCSLTCGLCCISCCASCIPKNRCGRLAFLVPLVPVLILMSPVIIILALLLGVCLLPFGRCRSGTDSEVLCHMKNKESPFISQSIESKTEPAHKIQERLVRRSLRTMSEDVSFGGFNSSATPPLSAAAVSSTLDVGRLSTLLDLHIFNDATFQLGTVATALGNCYRDIGGEYAGYLPNGSVVFWGMMLYQSMLDNHLINFFFDLTLGCRPRCLVTTVSWLFGRFIGGFTGVTKERVETTIRKIGVLRSKIATIRALDDVSKREWYYTMDLIRLSCCIWLGRLQIGIHLSLRHMPRAIRLRVVHELNRLIQEHRSLWICRSRIGGLDESASFLERVRDEVMTDLSKDELDDWRNQPNTQHDNNGYMSPSPEKKRV